MSGIKQDVFPCTVVFAEPYSTPAVGELTSAPPTKASGVRQISQARVIVFTSRILIAIDGPTGPNIVFDEDIDPTLHYKNPDRGADSYVVTKSGMKIAFRKDNMCGCGSRLRSWSPYKYVSSVKDPSS